MYEGSDEDDAMPDMQRSARAEGLLQLLHYVMKGCLAYHSELDAEWNTFVDVMDKLVERLLGPFNIEMVVQPINIKISEAIMNFQESSAQVSQRVFSSCGKPMLGRRRRSADHEPENYPRFRRGLEHEGSRESRNFEGLKGGRFRREYDGELRFRRENQGLKPDLGSDSRFRREYDDSRSGEESFIQGLEESTKVQNMIWTVI
ncbi:glypican-1-like [Nilaparvata lugens]|uniref:glypican-1-like n=1 Tax=Nilaparvata lugens TaxID=108931 RepID=UPI00193D309F|nr:glypican-1-like [Nilaparvata lugens]